MTEPASRHLQLRLEEPSFAPFAARPVAEVAAQLLALARERAGGRPGPILLAVDGRGGAGKTSATGALVASLTGGAVGTDATEASRVAVVHTDDLAWWEPYFAWGHLLRALVLAPLHGPSGNDGINVRPPAWDRQGRAGSIEVPAGTDIVLVEGTGAAQREVADLLDAVVWVQADWTESERRGIERDVAEGVNGTREEATAFWHDWQSAEVPFFAEDRPWERADLAVCGTPEQAGVALAENELALGTVGASGGAPG